MGILFSKNDANIKPDFYKACTLVKQHKLYNKKPSINTTDKSRVRLYLDLFSERILLLGIGDYKYGAILKNKASQIRFLMTMKLKNVICIKNKIRFREIEIFTNRKMQYFWSDKAEKY